MLLIQRIVAMVVIAFLVTIVLGGEVIAVLIVAAAGIWAIRFGYTQIKRDGLAPVEFEPDQFERSARWVGNEQISLEDHEILVHNALNGGSVIPTRLVDARALAAELRQPVLPAQDEGTTQMTIAPPEPSNASLGRLPRLPRGYFDGYLSDYEPENTDGWAEVRRGDGSTYWIRTQR